MKGATVLAAADANDASGLAADLLAARIRAALAGRGEAVMALSGGSTPWPAYQRLAVAADIDWARVTILQVDEREVPPDHPDSNLGGLIDALGRRASAQIVPLAGSVEAASAAYGRIVRERGGIDVALLGVGDDGHTASLVPGDPALDSRDVVARTLPYRGHTRLTLTFTSLDLCAVRIVLAHGPTKRKALHSALAGEGPAGRLRGAATWLVTTTESIGPRN
ncbi:MAG: 6-phosphogluconolactonase [Acidimicrobiales bacterium]|nr:6-phosphogluconolactonase [Acidimicrobiales bacterium]